MKNRLLSTAAFAALTVSNASLADVIADQPASSFGDAASQIFLDPYTPYTCSAFDDFTIAEGYDLTALTVYGSDSVGGNSSLNVSVVVRFPPTARRRCGRTRAAASATDRIRSR